MKESSDKFCKNTLLNNNSQEKVNFCMESKKTYPKVSSSNKILENHIRQAIHRELIRQQSPEAYVLNYTKEGNVGSSMGHESSISLKILSATERTFTLEGFFYSYLGGAHGMSSTILTNYDSKTGKKITLEDVFVPQYRAKLKEIVEKEYRIQSHIRAKDSLSERLDWFENKFILAQSIGFAKNGLHLEYNAYEIKSYAAGSTSIVIPYALLKSIIKPKGYLAPLIKTQNLNEGKIKQHFNDAFGNIHLSVEKLSKTSVKLILQVEKSYDERITKAHKGSISIAFPQLSQTSHVLSKSSQNIDKLMLYPKGHKIYNLSKNKNIQSKHLLLEGEVSRWEDEDKREIELTLQIPQNIKNLKLRYRITFKDGKKFLNIPYKGIRGQQGFQNYDIHIER
jgi:hypothetical protein